jgi:hypothetical protein
MASIKRDPSPQGSDNDMRGTNIQINSDFKKGGFRRAVTRV